MGLWQLTWVGHVPQTAASTLLCLSLNSAVRPVAKGASPGAALPAGEWETLQLRGCWRAGQTAGGSRNFASYLCNPCLPFSVPAGSGPRCIRITLHQHCQLSDSQLHPIGFHVFQVSSSAGDGYRGGPREPASVPCCPSSQLPGRQSLGYIAWAHRPSCLVSQEACLWVS